MFCYNAGRWENPNKTGVIVRPKTAVFLVFDDGYALFPSPHGLHFASRGAYSWAGRSVHTQQRDFSAEKTGRASHYARARYAQDAPTTTHPQRRTQNAPPMAAVPNLDTNRKNRRELRRCLGYSAVAFCSACFLYALVMLACNAWFTVPSSRKIML